ncbi:hypothetical protein BDA99DRAFT_86302 [Phascolomyces articulosus]|uniref:Uncharacterized protein n=1 Tax=Phascolomyces articulosus TaxID=60185 RepID=A0AAD5JYC3_9FUNG|nr:hypothetical protein BDA99DRAFT_86302 [Phascolomyces articulosus]
MYILFSCLVLVIFISPPYYMYHARHYIYFYVFFYGYILTDAGYHLYFDHPTIEGGKGDIIHQQENNKNIWETIHFGLCFFLFVITGTTPHPIHPFNITNQLGDKGDHKTRHSPEACASVFSWAVFQWVNPLVTFGFSNPISRNDLYPLTHQHRARYAHENFTAAIKENVSPTRITTGRMIRQLLYRIYKANEKSIWVQFIFSNAAVLISYLNPYFQQLFLEYIEQKKENTSSPTTLHVAYGYVLMMFLAALGKMLFTSIQLYVGRRWNIRTLCMLDAEIYAKALRRKDTYTTTESSKKKDGPTEDKDEGNEMNKNDEDHGDANNGIGKITNLMSLDADHIADLPAYIFMFYNAPLEMVIAMIYLYYLLGSAAIVGLGVLVIFFPMTYVLVNKVRQAYMNLSRAEDKRNNLVNELLQGIRIIKYAASELNWQSRIMDARNGELKQIRRTCILDIIMSVGYLTMPVLVSACSFIWYVKVCQRELTASVVFVSITLFDMLQSPIMLVPDAISAFTEAYVSLKRISAYLKDPEVQPPTRSDTSSSSSSSPRVGFDRSIFQWPNNNNSSTENDRNTTPSSEQPKEISEQTPLLSNNSDNDKKYVQDSSSSTSSHHTPFQLRILHAFDFPPNQLSLVYGSTGCGKSSLLHALLGEMDTMEGKAYLPLSGFPHHSNTAAYHRDNNNDGENDSMDHRGYHDEEGHTFYSGAIAAAFSNSVAYAAQQPFLLQATIRENILFGQPYEAERYQKVLWQCALVKDLSILPHGDQTEIGEKGISLSGGQKQRVSLARVIYSYAKVVLLDDCLSAVDSHTARHIFEHCINGSLLKRRTVVMVTHHIQLCLPAAHFLVRLDQDGTVAACDTVEKLQTSDKFIEACFAANNSISSDTTSSSSSTTETEMLCSKNPLIENNMGVVDGPQKEEIGKLIQDEQSEKGQVKMKVYVTYLRACGGWLFWVILALFFSTSRILVFAENWWLRIWAAAYTSSSQQTPFTSSFAHFGTGVFDDSDDGTINILQIHQESTAISSKNNITLITIQENTSNVTVDYYISVYVIICLTFVICDALRNILLYWGSIRGARTLFIQLLDRITHAPLRFFDTTPSGRILNRFGTDMTVIDMQMARTAGILIECLTGMIAASIIISVITPHFVVVAVATAFIYLIIGLYYLRSSRELKRLNSVNRSPIYSHFTETLSGVTTIRAFGQQYQFLSAMYDKLDTYITPYYLLWMVNRWLLIRMDTAGALMSFGAGILILQNVDSIDAGMAGISLIYARTFLVHVYWMIRQYTQVEINMNSVERIQEYLELDQEPRNQPKPPKYWPMTAKLQIRDLYIRYAPELDPVLRGISFDVHDKEKIGIVGRTGSGKTTLALSLFRFLEPSSSVESDAIKDGQIILDGIDITQIDLTSLRSSLTMIPQDAALFSGTIRSNLDPFEEHTEDALWAALERVHIKSVILDLDQPVSHGGQNFSQGQRQLLCMARALLRSNNKLIIMDEATASVDFEMDAKIQCTIRQAFQDSTLICVAHRLRTVIDYDRVLVIDQGRVVEYDTPWNLLNQSPPSLFRAMCEQSGELNTLIDMARPTTNTNK